MIPEITSHISERFETFFEKKETGCWLWKGALTPSGYGVFQIMYDTFRAHRVAWTIANGPIPDGMCVCHTCDNPACVRPDHLWLGTVSDNNQDKAKKGRVKTGWNKLNEQSVREIRQKAVAGAKQSVLAAEYGVTATQIHWVVRRKVWKNVV